MYYIFLRINSIFFKYLTIKNDLERKNSVNRLEPQQIFIGLLLSLLAGLSTALGALVVFFMKEKMSLQMISLSMGFSAGVMIGVSFFELVPSAIENLGILTTGICFLAGMIGIGLLDFLIPHTYGRERAFNERECLDPIDPGALENISLEHLMRTGLFVALGIGIHNFPEGFVTMTGSLQSLNLGLILAVAIAIHNIPEGLSVAIPIYCSSQDRKKAFKLSFYSGLAEPIGAIFGLIVLLTLGITPEIIEYALAFVAGIMIFISLDELLPTAHLNNNESDQGIERTGHIATGGIILGIFVMLLTLILINP